MTSVVIVGSGFTGFECARRLRKRNVDVTIISPIDYMLYTPLLPDVAGGVVDGRFVAIPLAGTLGGVRKIRGRVDSVDLNEHSLTFTDLEQRSCSLSWDRLVLTPGSVTRLFDIPGLATYARGLKSIAEALYLRDHVLEQLELSCLESDAESAQARRTIVVVGASYSGTELTAQLRALADAAAKHMDFAAGDVKFLLLDLAEQVMPEVGKKLGDKAMRVLRRRGVDVRLGLTLREVHPDYVVLSDGSRVNTHTVAWVTGVTASPLIETLGLPTEKGRLKVQTDLQVPGHPDVFAAGDLTSFPVKQGGIAAQQADAAAASIAARAGAPVIPEPFRPVLRGQLLTGMASRYLRGDPGSQTSAISTEPLWWPPAKIVGRHLSPFLAQRLGLSRGREPVGQGIPVDVALDR